MIRSLAVAFLAVLLSVPGGIAAQQQGDDPETQTEEKSVVPVLTVQGSISERRDPLQIFSKPTPTLRGWTETLRKAQNDPEVDAVVIRFIFPSWGMAQAMDFERAVRELRESGKPVYVSMDAGGIVNYTIATAASEIVMPPVGGLDLYGMNLGLYYFKGMLDKLGIEADAVSEGQFKDAFDPFLREEMSDSTRLQMNELLDDLFGTLRERVAENRAISEEEARDVLTLGPYTSGQAMEAGIIDRLAYFDEFLDSIEEEMGGEVEFDSDYTAAERKKPEMPNLMSLLTGGGFGKTASKDTEDRIAVVYAIGPIIDGRVDKSNPFLQSDMVASDDFIELIDEVMEEEGVKALVLRVDSPGGSAIASDRIWNRLEQVQASGVPVVVSMGNVAASGGYYISMGADSIVAQPSTITGSIGVIGGKFSLAGTYEKIGVAKQRLGIGPHAGIYSETSTWTDQEEKILGNLLGSIYEDFTTKAARERGMELDELKEVAGGRVWSGVDAQRVGLVDEMGSLHRAVEIARNLGNAGEAKVTIYPKPLTFPEMLEKIMAGEMSAGQGLSIQGASRPELLALAKEIVPERHLNTLLFAIHAMKNRPAAMTLMPYCIDVPGYSAR